MSEPPDIQALIDRAAVICAGIRACHGAVLEWRTARFRPGAKPSAEETRLNLWMDDGMRVYSECFVRACYELSRAVPAPRYAEYLGKVHARTDALLQARPGEALPA